MSMLLTSGGQGSIRLVVFSVCDSQSVQVEMSKLFWGLFRGYIGSLMRGHQALDRILILSMPSENFKPLASIFVQGL